MWKKVDGVSEVDYESLFGRCGGEGGFEQEKEHYKPEIDSSVNLYCKKVIPYW